MVFTRFVEIGRVALINYGPDCGKLCTIIDVVDAKRVLVDGPQSITGVHRQVILIKRISLTDIVVRISRNATLKNITKAWKEADALAKWDACAWAKKLASKKTRSNLTDFDRFKVMIAKKQRAEIVTKKVAELK
jgi:large subunit ribosomal protein L14e